MTARKKYDQATMLKVGENLYRNESSGTYYGIVKRSGKQIKRSLKTKDFAMAKRYLKQFETKVDRMDPMKGKVKIAFKDLAKRWLRIQKPNLKASSYTRKQTSINALNKHFGNLNVRSITKRHCENWAVKRAPERSASTFNNEKETLNSILGYAIKEGITIDNPARYLKRRKVGKKELIIPSKEQFRALLKKLRSMDIRYHHAANLIELLAHSGMRKGEANGFKWRDVDYSRGQFIVTGGNIGTKNHDVRIVPLFPALKRFLKRLEDDRIFDDPEDLVVPILSAKNALMTACKLLEFPNFTHHSLRHYFVSNAIEKGVDFKTIAAWVGHKDGGILVAQTYGHLRDTHSKEMAKLMTE